MSTEEDHDHGAGDCVSVVSDIAPDGTYVTTIQYGPDLAWTLTPDQGMRYAATVIAATTRAEYDAAAFAQMTHLGLELRDAAEPIIQLRADRPPLDDKATAPFVFVPIVSQRTREPFVQVHLAGESITQWTPAEARGHALHVLEVASAVDLDATYYRWLTGALGLDENRGRAVVEDLFNHRVKSSSD